MNFNFHIAPKGDTKLSAFIWDFAFDWFLIITILHRLELEHKKQAFKACELEE